MSIKNRLLRNGKHISATEDIQGFLAQLNMKRAMMVAKIAIAFQFASMFGEHMKHYEFMRIASIATVSLATVYLIVMHILERYVSLSNKHSERIVIGFWIVFALEMAPFIYSDVVYSSSPVNAIIFCIALAVAPVFKPARILALYIPLFAYMMGILFIAGADTHLLLSGVVIGISGIVLAYALQNSFIHILDELRLENETDQLTKCFTKQAGMRKMRDSLALCRRLSKGVAVFFIDIDNFKNYNDTFGHLAGDDVLARVAEAVLQTFGRETDIAVRIGGEGFAVMTADVSIENAVPMGKALASRITDMGIRSGAGAVFEKVSVSIGIAVRDEGSVRTGDGAVEEIINEADKQLYIAKSAGRNCVAYSGRVTLGKKLDHRSDGAILQGEVRPVQNNT